MVYMYIIVLCIADEVIACFYFLLRVGWFRKTADHFMISFNPSAVSSTFSGDDSYRNHLNNNVLPTAEIMTKLTISSRLNVLPTARGLNRYMITTSKKVGKIDGVYKKKCSIA